jgi:hypothetical protein
MVVRKGALVTPREEIDVEYLHIEQYIFVFFEIFMTESAEWGV